MQGPKKEGAVRKKLGVKMFEKLYINEGLEGLAIRERTIIHLGILSLLEIRAVI